jgi:signal transduction histidine kinase
MPDPWLNALFIILAALAGVLLGRSFRAPVMRPSQAERAFSQAAGETQAIGLALRRLALADPPDRAGLNSLALQCLDVSDHLHAALAGPEHPRRLVDAPTPLAPLLEQSLAVARGQLGNALPPCRVDPSVLAVTLRADARALRGAVAQVLARAARLAAPGEGLALRFILLGDVAAIIIEDDGAGQALPDMAATAPLDATRGVGFGLGLARSLLRAHGGDLVLESAPGIGTRAWLTLPAERLYATAQA